MLAPRGMGDEGVVPRPLPSTTPRPGLIPVRWEETQVRSLELERPDLLALALRHQATELRTRLERTEAPLEIVSLELLELPAVGLGPPGVQPVAEPPAGLLLFVAGPLVAGLRQRPKRGSRFSRNASMPSIASASSRLSAITAPASR
ncbi:MAG: hypothetical protein ABFS41_19700 [Myxococcota bacterium]